MLTGDGRRAARKIAEETGITETCAEMLPQDKAKYIKELREKGRRVVMIGDGYKTTRLRCRKPPSASR